jgi:NAD-dependent oxidoreductase involved in siderophore biosynthesis
VWSICSPSTAPAKIAFLPTLMPRLKLMMASGGLALSTLNEQRVIWSHPVAAWTTPLVGNQPLPARAAGVEDAAAIVGRAAATAFSSTVESHGTLTTDATWGVAADAGDDSARAATTRTGPPVRVGLQ